MKAEGGLTLGVIENADGTRFAAKGATTRRSGTRAGKHRRREHAQPRSAEQMATARDRRADCWREEGQCSHEVEPARADLAQDPAGCERSAGPVGSRPGPPRPDDRGWPGCPGGGGWPRCRPRRSGPGPPTDHGRPNRRPPIHLARGERGRSCGSDPATRGRSACRAEVTHRDCLSGTESEPRRPCHRHEHRPGSGRPRPRHPTTHLESQ